LIMADRLLTIRRVATLELVGDAAVRRALAVVAFTLMTAFGAYAQVRLPGIPVPITLQTLFVLLSGAMLGPQLGALSQLLYLTAGAAGLPVFAGGIGVWHLLGPTGGYLVAFPLAAYVTGILVARVPAERGSMHTLRVVAAVFLGSIVVFVGGAAQLAILTGDAATAIRIGVVPFLAGDAVKVLLAALIAQRLRPRLRRLL
jgi:biotin transport system substrate-specific component